MILGYVVVTIRGFRAKWWMGLLLSVGFLPVAVIGMFLNPISNRLVADMCGLTG